MEEGRPSSTAMIAAMWRAAHLLWDEDPLALGFRRSGNGCLVSGILAFGSAQRSKGNSYNS